MRHKWSGMRYLVLLWFMVYSSTMTNDPNDPDHLDHSPHRQHTKHLEWSGDPDHFNNSTRFAPCSSATKKTKAVVFYVYNCTTKPFVRSELPLSDGAPPFVWKGARIRGSDLRFAHLLPTVSLSHRGVRITHRWVIEKGKYRLEIRNSFDFNWNCFLNCSFFT